MSAHYSLRNFKITGLYLYILLASLLIIVGCGSSSRGSGIGRPIAGKIALTESALPTDFSIILETVDASGASLQVEEILTGETGEFMTAVDPNSSKIIIRFDLQETEFRAEFDDIPSTSARVNLEILADSQAGRIVEQSISVEPGASSEPPSESTPSVTEAQDPSDMPEPANPRPTPTTRPPQREPAPENTPVVSPSPQPTAQATPTTLPATPVPTSQPAATTVVTSAPTPQVLTPTLTPTISPTLEATNCLDVQSQGVTTSGIYSISVTGRTIDAYCDMETDGGGWTLVLNYLHKSGTSPSTIARTDELPFQVSTTLGEDESETTAWGHAAPSLLAQFEFAELRFFCRSTGGEFYLGPVHFVTMLTSCLDYARTGTGTCLGVEGSFRALNGHTPGGLPLTTDFNEHGKDNGDRALLARTFVKGNNDKYWNIRSRFEGNIQWDCNDRRSLDTTDTHHQVWIR